MGSGRSLAFQLARPLRPVVEEATNVEYDPQSQMTMWRGESAASAAVCTRTVIAKRCRRQYGACFNVGQVGLIGSVCDR